MGQLTSPTLGLEGAGPSPISPQHTHPYIRPYAQQDWTSCCAKCWPVNGNAMAPLKKHRGCPQNVKRNSLVRARFMMPISSCHDHARKVYSHNLPSWMGQNQDQHDACQVGQILCSLSIHRYEVECDYRSKSSFILVFASCLSDKHTTTADRVPLDQQAQVGPGQRQEQHTAHNPRGLARSWSSLIQASCVKNKQEHHFCIEKKRLGSREDLTKPRMIPSSYESWIAWSKITG